MAWTTLTTIEELQINLPTLVSGEESLVKMEDVITAAQDAIYDDLSKIVDWDDIETLTTVPRIINRLAQYQACVIALERNWQDDDTVVGDGPEAQNNAYKMWKDKYNALLKQVKLGEVIILDDDNEELSYDYAKRPGLGRII